MTRPIQIRGGADAVAAAAIAAVITHVLAEEVTDRANPPSGPHQSAWVQAWRPREVHAPTRSHLYDAGGSGTGED